MKMTEEKNYLEELGELLRRANELVIALKANGQPPKISKEKTREKNEERTRDFLKDLGAPLKNKGYGYIKMAVVEGLEDPSFFDRGITKNVYPTIAQKFKTTSSKVERGIRHEKGIILSSDNEKLLKELFPHYETGVTNKEFLTTIVDYLKRKEN